MAHVSELIAGDIEAYLAQHRHKDLLRFITCGSVDDGKSTLIGRLLYDSKMIFEDQLAALEADSRRIGSQGQEIDFALLVDGLAAEREQGITIDVAYRFFSTDKRKFIVADTPGHEQYTRNMVTGASTADLAVILIDARKGVLTQTRRHSYLAHLVGISKIVLAVTKMDLIGYDQVRYDDIVADYRTFAASIGIADFIAIPVSGLRGDNIISASAETPWYDGPPLMEYLETVAIDSDLARAQAFALPVQWVSRPNLDFRGFSGLIVAGAVKLAGPALWGTFGVADYAIDSSPEAQEFAKLYAEVSKAPADNYSSWTYDAIGVLSAAINKAGSTDPDKIRAAILSTKGYKGAEGEYNFDEFGDGLHGYNIVRNEKGVIVFDKHIEFKD